MGGGGGIYYNKDRTKCVQLYRGRKANKRLEGSTLVKVSYSPKKSLCL